MKKKLLYEVPEAEQFFVRFEQGILTVSDGVNESNHTRYFNGGGLEDEYETL